MSGHKEVFYGGIEGLALAQRSANWKPYDCLSDGPIVLIPASTKRYVRDNICKSRIYIRLSATCYMLAANIPNVAT